MTVRLATYNVRGMKDSVPALTRVIGALRADLLCVQEAPRLLGWRSRREALAGSCGLRVVAGRRLGGVAVFAAPRVRLIDAESHVLRIFAGLEARGLAIAVVEVEGARLAVGSTHLDLNGAARLRHVTEAMALLEAAAARFGAAPVLCGDFNERDHQPAWRYAATRLTDCYPAAPRGDGPTFTARHPQARIDAVFASPDLRVHACGGAEAAPADLAAASDHLPVVAELESGAGLRGPVMNP
ncbi:endonuclease/exonuclease/phosphatase family protein [Nonomuraea sp. NPDC005501]|uniref:endonuclease/exonuclease/phosphatase family protein n=1 Tax=Nonomuraea sp. NPDC005501 TaxID=3156884 RepID=UPI0033AE6FE1